MEPKVAIQGDVLRQRMFYDKLKKSKLGAGLPEKFEDFQSRLQRDDESAAVYFDIINKTKTGQVIAPDREEFIQTFKKKDQSIPASQPSSDDLPDPPEVPEVDEDQPSAFTVGLREGMAMIKGIPDQLRSVVASRRIRQIDDAASEFEKMDDDVIVTEDGRTAGDLKQEFNRVKTKEVNKAVDAYFDNMFAMMEASGGRTDIPQDISQIKSASDLGKFAAKTIGQMLPVAGASIPTLGLGSVLIETGSIQQDMISEVAKKANLTPRQVIERGLTDPKWAVSMGLAAGALDFLSLGFIGAKVGLGEVAKKGLKEAAKKVALAGIVSGGTEALTEGAQGELEAIGAAQGTEDYEFDLNRLATNTLAGGIGGLALGAGGRVIRESIGGRRTPDVSMRVDAPEQVQTPEGILGEPTTQTQEEARRQQMVEAIRKQKKPEKKAPSKKKTTTKVAEPKPKKPTTKVVEAPTEFKIKKASKPTKAQTKKMTDAQSKVKDNPVASSVLGFLEGEVIEDNFTNEQHPERRKAIGSFLKDNPEAKDRIDKNKLRIGNHRRALVPLSDEKFIEDVPEDIRKRAADHWKKVEADYNTASLADQKKMTQETTKIISDYADYVNKPASKTKSPTSKSGKPFIEGEPKEKFGYKQGDILEFTNDKGFKFTEVVRDFTDKRMIVGNEREYQGFLDRDRPFGTHQSPNSFRDWKKVGNVLDGDKPAKKDVKVQEPTQEQPARAEKKTKADQGAKRPAKADKDTGAGKPRGKDKGVASALRRAKAAKEGVTKSVEGRIRDVNQQIRQTESLITNAKNQGFLTEKGNPKKSAPQNVKNFFTKLESLKEEKANFEAQATQEAKVQEGLKKADSRSVIALENTITEPDGTTVNEYNFRQKGVKGSIVQETTPEGDTMFFASNEDGSITSDGYATAQEAVNEVVTSQPQKITQTGKVVSVDEDVISPSQQQTAANMGKSPEFVRANFLPRKEGEPTRQVRLAIKDKDGKGRLKTLNINQKGNIEFSTSVEEQQFKQQFPKTWETIKDNSTVKVREVPKTDLQRKAQNVADNIRKGKIDVPKGALRATAGFEIIWNNALEVVAQSIEKGADFFEAMRKGARYIRSTKEYKALDPEVQKTIIPQLEKAITDEFNAQDIPVSYKRIKSESKTLKQQIAEDLKRMAGIRPNTLDMSTVKEARKAIRELIFKRRAIIDLGNFETNIFKAGINDFTHFLEKETGVKAKKYREIMPFLIEGAKSLPKELNRPDLQEAWDNRKKLAPIIPEVKKYFDEKWNEIKKYNDDISAEQVDDYVTHIWDIPANQNIQNVTNYFSTKNRFLKQRYIDTLVEGITKFGLTPKVLDINEILRIHGRVANNANGNNQFVQDLKSMRLQGNPILLPDTKAPSNWAMVNHPSMVRQRALPEIRKFLEPVFGQRIDQKWLNYLSMVDGLLKRINLSISLFHHLALLEAGLAKQGPITPLKMSVKEAFHFFKQIQRGEPTNVYAFREPEITRDALQHNLQLGITEDIPEDVRKNAFEKWGNRMIELGKELDMSPSQIKSTMGGLGWKVAGNTVKGAGQFIDRWDRFLWEYFHDGLKLYAYQDAVSKMPPKFTTEEQIRQYKIEQAQFINDTFGGQNWDTLMISPQQVQLMRFMLLSPDWTVSTFRQAIALAGGKGSVYENTRSVRWKEAGKFWGRVALMIYPAINVLNAYFRERDFEENKEKYINPDGTQKKSLSIKDLTMLGNTVGHKTHLFVGRYPDGTERYVRWGKQFRELPEFFLDESFQPDPQQPLKKLGGKASPVAQIISKLTTGKSLSGFEDWDLKDKKGLEWGLGAMKMLGKSALPFATSATFRDDKPWYATDLFVPSSKGLSMTKQKNLFMEAIIANDPEQMAQIYADGIKNGLDSFRAFDVAIREVRLEASREFAANVKSQEEAKQAMKDAPNAKELVMARDRLRRLKRIEAEQKKARFRLKQMENQFIRFRAEFQK